MRTQKAEVTPTIVDKIVEWASPEAGVRRRNARAMLSGSSYTGASSSRATLKNWGGLRGYSPRQADSFDRPELRERCNSVYRNEPLARGAVNKIVECVVGPGLAHRASIRHDIAGVTPDRARALEKEIERYWDAWAGSVYADITLEGSFHDIARASMYDERIEGDVLAVRRYKTPGDGRRKHAFAGTCFQLIESSRVCNENGAPNTATTIDGVNLSPDGVVESYSIRKKHPGDVAGEDGWVRIQAWDRMGNRRARMLYDRQRVGTYRGIPWLSVILEELKLVNDARSADAYRRLIQSFMTAFVTSQNGEAFSTANPSMEDEQADLEDDEQAMGPGHIVFLKPGENITMAVSPSSAADFAEYHRAMAEHMAVGTNMPAEIFLQKFGQSFSASKAAIEEFWRGVRIAVAWWASHLYQFAKESLVTELVASRRLVLPGFLRDPMIRQAYLGSRWTGGAAPQVDPLKAVKAREIAEDRGWVSPEQNAAELFGTDIESNLEKAAEVKRMKDEHGLSAPAPQQPASGDDGIDADVNGDPMGDGEEVDE